MKLSGKISVHNFIVLILILSTFLIDNGADGCFLNSCPYRRYGRNLKCGSCTGTSDGICVSETICCGDKSCVYDSDCMTKQTCPLRFCEINDHLGFCISPLMCCNDEICKPSSQCMKHGPSTTSKLKRHSNFDFHSLRTPNIEAYNMV